MLRFFLTLPVLSVSTCHLAGGPSAKIGVNILTQREIQDILKSSLNTIFNAHPVYFTSYLVCIIEIFVEKISLVVNNLSLRVACLRNDGRYTYIFYACTSYLEKVGWQLVAGVRAQKTTQSLKKKMQKCKN